MLGYRSTFDVALDPAVGLTRDNAVETLLGEGFSWLRKQKGIDRAEDYAPLEEHSLPNGARLIHTHGRTQSGTEYGRLTFFDAPQPAGQWVTTLLVGLADSSHSVLPRISIEIDAPADPSNEGKPHWTARPRLARQFLENYQCTEHGLSLSPRPVYLADDELVPTLIAGLTNERRRNLVLVTSEDGSIPVEAWKSAMAGFTEQTLGQASCYILGPAAATAFNEAVSLNHRVTAYSPRTFYPPVDIEDPFDGARHRVFRVQNLLASRKGFLTSFYGRICREHSNAQPVEKYFRRLDLITAQAFDAALNPAPTIEVPAQKTAPDHGTDSRVPAPLEDPLRSVKQLLAEPVGEDAAQPAHTSTAMAAEDVRALVAENAQLRAEQADRDGIELSLRELLEQANGSIRALEAAKDELELLHMEEIDELERRHREEVEAQGFETLLRDEDLRASAATIRTLNFQLDQARSIIASHGIDPSGSRLEPEARYEQQLGEWDEIPLVGEETFPNLIFTCDWKKMMLLADRDETGVWFKTTWDSLSMLDDYCRFRRTAGGEAFAGGLREYLNGGAPSGAFLIPPDRYRSTESEQVQGARKYAAERVFDVPEFVDPSGKATMLSHIVIQTKGSVSPRMYFLDCTSTIGKIVIGYIGRHPKNTMTN